MKNILQLLALIFAANCTYVPVVTDRYQCTQIKSILIIEGKEYVDIEKSYCACRMYHFGSDYVGKSIGAEVERFDYKTCADIIGWKPKDYSDIAAYWESVRFEVTRDDK